MDVIRVAGGTYVPSVPVDPNDPRTATFFLDSGVELYGGYAGMANPSNPDLRNPAQYESILSGDRAGNDGAGFANNDENSYHVVNADGIASTGLLDGFVISAGNANAEEYPYRDGGGMIVDNQAGPTINACVFRDNYGYMGGGLFCYFTQATVNECLFEGNVSDWGGAVNNSTADTIFTDCVFNNNTSNNDGGAVRNVGGGMPTLIDCIISNNHAVASGAGMMNVEESNPTLIGCDIMDNTADGAGGGMYCTITSSPMIVNCNFMGNTAGSNGGAILARESSSPTITNCKFIDNSAVINGGAIITRLSSEPVITNCTFSGNSATSSGGGIFIKSNPVITNCVFWSELPQAIFVEGGVPVITYCDVEGGWDGTGNIDADPGFVDGYYLGAGSPCIDAGNNYAVPVDTCDLDGDNDTAERTPLDLDGNDRFVNDGGTVDTGMADPPNYPDVVDMGVYEYGLCMGDLDGDGQVGLSDLAQLLGSYGETSGMTYEDGDLDGDGDVDLTDLAELLGVYGDQC